MSSRLIAAACLAFVAAPAAADPARCNAMVAEVRSWLDAHPHISGTRRQTVDAQLQHQPTAASIAKAKMESRDHIVELLGDAEMLQRSGDMAGCEAKLADVERMLAP
jgi:hypothetical protein